MGFKIIDTSILNTSELTVYNTNRSIDDYNDSGFITITGSNQWYDGSGVPSNSLGEENDYYLDTDTGDVYKKGSSVWTSIGNIQGPAGVSGDKHYTHTQGISSNAWAVNHNLNKVPAPNVRTSGGDWISTGSIIMEIIDLNNVVLHWASSFTGEAYFN
jgi:hypothetical protein